MKTTGEIIKDLRIKKGYSTTDLAKILNLKSHSTISKWELGENHPRGKEIKMLCKLFNISSDYLLGLEKENNVSNKQEKYKQTITVYGKIAAGEPLEMIEDVDEIICPWATDTGNLFALQVKGDSMNKVVLNKHYAVLEKCEEAVTGKIYAVIVDNENATLKRIHVLDDGVMLEPLSTNPEHERKTYEGEKAANIKVIGKYIGCVSPYRDN